VLGPVDPQLGQYPAASLLKVVSKKPIAEVDDDTLILADVGEKAIVQLREAAKDLLARSQSPEKGEELARLLSTGTWTHDYPITFEDPQRLGLNVSSNMPPMMLQLMGLFPQPVRRQSSVEFLPVPRRAESPKPREVTQAGR
jgi:ClpP class serine protease